MCDHSQSDLAIICFSRADMCIGLFILAKDVWSLITIFMVQHLRQAEIEFPTGSLYTIQTLDTERPLGIKSPQDQSHLTYIPSWPTYLTYLLDTSTWPICLVFTKPDIWGWSFLAALASCGNFWHIVAPCGNLCHLLAPFGNLLATFWQLLATFGNFCNFWHLPICPTYLTYLTDLPIWPSYPTWQKKTFSLIQTITRAVSQFLWCFLNLL